MSRVGPGRIDLHTHGIPPDVPAFAARYAGDWPSLVHREGCQATIMLGGRHFRDVDDRCWDPARRCEDMDAEGVAAQVVSPIPVTFRYGLPADGVRDLSRFQDEWIAGLCRDRPDRFLGLGTVPLHDPATAAEMVRWCVRDLGLAGVELGTNVVDGTLDEDRYDQVFAAAEEVGALVFFHPFGVLGEERLSAYGLSYSVGMQAETALLAATLVMGGVLDRHPALRIVLAHGGGAFVAMLPRISQAWATLPGVERRIAQPPSAYVDRFHYDSLTYDPGMLARLVTAVGADRVLLGTDYPFPIAERPAGAAVDAAAASGGLDPAQHGAVLDGTARRLLGLDPAPAPSG